MKAVDDITKACEYTVAAQVFWEQILIPAVQISTPYKH